MSKRCTRLLVAAAAFVAVGVFALRVWSINADAAQISVETHDLGEEIDLDGAFCEYSSENTEGYTIEVVGATEMTPREYAESYASGEVDTDEEIAALFETDDSSDSADAKTEIVLEVKVTNNGSDDGHIHALSWRLVPTATKDSEWQCDFEVWAIANPAIAGQIGFSIKPNSSMTLFIPFSRSENAGFMEKQDYGHKVLATQESYELIISNQPVRHVVSVGVPKVAS